MIQSLPSFCQGRFVSLYSWEVLTTWQGPHTHLWLMLRTPNSTYFNDAPRIMISALGCITCQKHFNLPWVKGSSIDAGVYPEKQLLIFSLPTPNIHSSFYLPHNIEMKEAKSVCPLESIVTTAITQVIWSKLRHPAWFFYALTSRQQKKERVAPKKAKCSRGTSWERSLIHPGIFQGQFQPIFILPEIENSSATCLFKHPHVCGMWMLLTAGGDNQQVKWKALAAYLLVFLNKVHSVAGPAVNIFPLFHLMQ